MLKMSDKLKYSEKLKYANSLRLKDSLQSLVLKRLQKSENRADIKTIWERSDSEQTNEVSPDDTERIKARRIQNKESAKKSREKYKKRVEQLEKEFHKLKRENQSLMSEIAKLKAEIDESKIYLNIKTEK